MSEPTWGQENVGNNLIPQNLFMHNGLAQYKYNAIKF